MNGNRNLLRRMVEGRPDAELTAQLRNLLAELERASAATELARAS